MSGTTSRIPLPAGCMVTVAVRWRPLGVGVVFWTARQLDEARQRAELIDMDD